MARTAPLLLDAGGWLVYEDPAECPGAFNKNDLKFFAAELAFGSGLGPTAVQSSAQLDGRPGLLPLTKLNVGSFDLSIGPTGVRSTALTIVMRRISASVRTRSCRGRGR